MAKWQERDGQLNLSAARGCEAHRAKTTTHTCSTGSKLLTRGKNSQRNAYVVWYDNKCLHFRMLSVKQGQVEPKHYLFHIHSKSLSDYKAWMMTNTRQNKTKPQILTESAGWIAVTSTSVQTDRSYRSPQGSWDRTLHPGQQPIRNSSPRTNAFFFFWFGVFGLCRALHTICQQLYSSSSSRNYQDVTLVSHRFNAICEAGGGCQGSFWSSLTTAQQNHNWENSSCNLIHLEQFQCHLRVHRAVTGGWR